jgi:diacylglycerol kinase (ATP)
VVVAVGGDGTVGACAGGLADAGPGARAALGVIPAGGGNDAVGALGVPLGDPMAAAELLPRLPRRRADLARVGERSYLAVSGAGFDSEVNRIANQRLWWAGAHLRYLGAALAQLVIGRPAGSGCAWTATSSSSRPGWSRSPTARATAAACASPLAPASTTAAWTWW